jgi:hypothetical protein
MSLPTCPKCAYQRLPTDAHIHAGVCPACGIAYQKFLDRQSGRAPVDSAPVLSDEPEPIGLLLAPPPMVDATAFGARAAAWCALLVWGAWFTLHGIDWESIGSSFLHSVNLPFHEFGHVLFMPFGRIMSILGGSLFQVLMPLGLMLLFLLRQRDTFAASVMLWWAGQSLVDLSPYIADAPLRSLPLVGGGDEDGHDWGNLLTMMGMLEQAHIVARLCFLAGVLVMAGALVWGVLLLRLQYAKMKAPQN